MVESVSVSGGNFQVNITVAGFLPFSPAFLTESCSFWHGLKDLFLLPKLDGKDPCRHFKGDGFLLIIYWLKVA